MALRGQSSRGLRGLQVLSRRFQDIENSETVENFCQEATDENSDWKIFGPPLYTVGGFCVEAINTCQETVLFEIYLNRKEKNLSQITLPKVKDGIIKALIDIERTYLEKMKSIIEYYGDKKLSSSITQIIGNIKEIYHETEKMHSGMEKCASADDVAKVFLDNLSVFEYYIIYLRNKTNLQRNPMEKFDDITKETETKLQDFEMPDQKPGEYKYILENLKKASTEEGKSCKFLEEAITLIDASISKTDTLLAIDSIQSYPNDLKNVGRFIMKDTFAIKEKGQNVIFLFEKYIIFCKDIGNDQNAYDYIDRIEIEKLILTQTINSKRFQLRSFKSSKNKSEYQFDIESPSMSTKTKWVDEITRILWNQLQYYRENYADLNAKGVIDKYQVDEELDSDSENSLCAGAPTLYDDYDVLGNEGTDLYDASGVNEGAPRNEESDSYYENILKSDAFRNTETTLHIENNLNEDTLHKTWKTEVFRSDSLDNQGDGSKIITELIHCTEAHLRDMKNMIDKIKSFGTADFPAEMEMLYETVEDMFQETRMFRLELIKCDTAYNVAKVFLENAHIFDTYIKYMRNNAIFSRCAMDKKKRASDKYVIESYSLNLILTTLAVLLEKLQKKEMEMGQPQCFGWLCEAIELLNKKITEANTLIAIDSIPDCPVDLKDIQPFIMKELFKLKRRYNRILFLFERGILVCKRDKILLDTYKYIDIIEMRSLKITDSKNSSSFELIESQKPVLGIGRKRSFTLEAPTNSVKEIWTRKIKNLLWKYGYDRNSNGIH